MNQRVEHLTSNLRDALPVMGGQLIESHVDMSRPANQSFAANPNDPSEHAPSWHQFGIVEHSKKFQDNMEGSVLEYVESWGLGEPVREALSVEIDGVSKQDLLSVAALLHDIGKFTGRKIEDRTSGLTAVTFAGHETESGRLIRKAPIHGYLTTHGLTADQIEYVARAAELHFELGKMWRVAKGTDIGYTMKFVESPACKGAIQEIISEHPDFAIEIGLQFIADAISKSDDFARATNDEGIETERPMLAEKIAAKGLNHMLISQALQVPVNLRVAEEYLRAWSRHQTTHTP